MPAIEPMDRVTEIIQGASARKLAARDIVAYIEMELNTLRATPRTASLQHYLLGVQRALKEEQAAAMHLIADVAALRNQVEPKRYDAYTQAAQAVDADIAKSVLRK